MTQDERRAGGMAYRVSPELMDEMHKCRLKLRAFNTMDPTDEEGLTNAIAGIFGKSDHPVVIPPFYCDYGSHIEVGKGFYANYGCTITDVGKVTIGENVLLGPHVSIFTAGHPVHPASRATLYEYGIPVTIEDGCWIGGCSVILPGITIGKYSVIGAGSVVTKNIPPMCIAAGNPCRVIRKITDEDVRVYFRNREFDPEAMEEVLAAAERFHKD